MELIVLRPDFNVFKLAPNHLCSKTRSAFATVTHYLCDLMRAHGKNMERADG